MDTSVPRPGEVIEAPVTGKLLQTVGPHLDAPAAEPVAPRLAATVMLVADSPGTAGGPQVFMLRRAATMAFVPDAVVFPGGRVDPLDHDPDIKWAGPSAAEWAGHMGCDTDTARALVVAAAREVLEETGVVLASPEGQDSPGTSESGISAQDKNEWAQDRDMLARHAVSLAQVLAKRGLVLRTDWLGLRSRWVTPEFEPRRYDTYFFSALVPPGQTPDSATLEAAGGGFATPAQLFAQAEAGQILLLPPTACNLRYLTGAESASDFVGQRVKTSPIMLAPEVKPDGQVVLTCVLP